jgi:hypothetical protein
MVILKSVKHFKNSQRIDYATIMVILKPVERETLQVLFQGKARAHSCPDLPLGQSQRTRFLRIPKHKMIAHVY